MKQGHARVLVGLHSCRSTASQALQEQHVPQQGHYAHCQGSCWSAISGSKGGSGGGCGGGGGGEAAAQALLNAGQAQLVRVVCAQLPRL
jgi:hypothetical protein